MYDTNYRLFLHKALGVGCAPARRRLCLRLTLAKFLICNLRTISIRYLLNLFQSNFLTRYNFVDCYTSSLLHLGPSHYARDYHEYRPFFEEKKCGYIPQLHGFHASKIANRCFFYDIWLQIEIFLTSKPSYFQSIQ